MTDVIHLTLTIPEAMRGQRIDAACAKLFPIHSRARLQTWIKSGELRVNGQCVKPKEAVQGGETIEIRAKMVEDLSQAAQALDLNIVFEDDAIIVLNKPAGLVVHPAAGHLDQTLLNALLAHFPGSRSLPRAGIVHRLDKDTTGLMVVAKTLEAHTSLVQQLQARTIHRGYAALVNGTIRAGSTINAPIGRHPNQRLKMAVVPHGKIAITHFRIRERFLAHTYLEVRLETGRTHQIRVHLSSIHHPIVGDLLYGGRPQLPKGCLEEARLVIQAFNRQALHAERLSLVHPVSGETLSWEAPLPEDFAALLAAVRLTRASNSQ